MQKCIIITLLFFYSPSQLSVGVFNSKQKVLNMSFLILLTRPGSLYVLSALFCLNVDVVIDGIRSLSKFASFEDTCLIPPLFL